MTITVLIILDELELIPSYGNKPRNKPYLTEAYELWAMAALDNSMETALKHVTRLPKTVTARVGVNHV